MATDPIPPAGKRLLRRRISERIEAREFVLPGRITERQYTFALQQVAQRVGTLVRQATRDGNLTGSDAARLIEKLNRFSDGLGPWANTVAERMVMDVSRRDFRAWQEHGKAISRNLRVEVSSAPTGVAMGRALAEQAQKITSLPRDAAERLFKLTTEAMFNGTRASEIAKEIMRSGEVTASRAKMLARTGVSSTATALTKARAEFIGSTEFVWRTSRDGAVRSSHRRLEGRVFRWDDPPEVDGFRGLPGEFANCRCFCEPVIPSRVASAISMNSRTFETTTRKEN